MLDARRAIDATDAIERKRSRGPLARYRVYPSRPIGAASLAPIGLQRSRCPPIASGPPEHLYPYREIAPGPLAADRAEEREERAGRGGGGVPSVSSPPAPPGSGGGWGGEICLAATFPPVVARTIAIRAHHVQSYERRGLIWYFEPNNEKARQACT